MSNRYVIFHILVQNVYHFQIPRIYKAQGMWVNAISKSWKMIKMVNTVQPVHTGMA